MKGARMAGTWSVRRAILNDAEMLADLASETFPLACPQGMDAAAVASHIRRRLSVDAFRINMADVGLEYSIALRSPDFAAGYVLLAGRDQESAADGLRRMELRQIYVRESHHGTGLAAELLGVVLDRARELEFDSVWLGTSKLNPRAIAFYQRHGFRVSGERVFLVADVPNEDWLMVRSLRHQG